MLMLMCKLDFMLQLCENFVTAEWFPTTKDDVTGFSCVSRQTCGHCVTWLDVLHSLGALSLSVGKCCHCPQ